MRLLRRFGYLPIAVCLLSPSCAAEGFGRTDRPTPTAPVSTSPATTSEAYQSQTTVSSTTSKVEAESGANTRPEELLYTFASGDTLYDLARRFLDSGERWLEIAELNDIDDPTKIPNGKRLRIRIERSGGSVTLAPRVTVTLAPRVTVTLAPRVTVTLAPRSSTTLAKNFADGGNQNDGIWDRFDRDADNDGIWDRFDRDADNDNIWDRFDRDADNDNIWDRFDRDCDNDGIWDQYDQDDGGC